MLKAEIQQPNLSSGLSVLLSFPSKAQDALAWMLVSWMHRLRGSERRATKGVTFDPTLSIVLGTLLHKHLT